MGFLLSRQSVEEAPTSAPWRPSLSAVGNSPSNAEQLGTWTTPPPIVTARSWAIVDGNSGCLLFGVDAREQREMASLTKIMTLYTVLKVGERGGAGWKETEVAIPENAPKVMGTKAGVRGGDVFRVDDLLYAMMLPSGNEVALCLAECFGQTVAKEENKDAISNPMIARKYFIHEMNKNAKELQLTRTKYNNPTGLSDKFNKSTAEDLGKLSAAALKLPYFKTIVSTKTHSCLAKNKEGEETKYSWTNTNKMLERGFNGVKTGITPNAGPCLASSIEISGRSLVIVLLNSKSVSARWIETEILKEWAAHELKLQAEV